MDSHSSNMSARNPSGTSVLLHILHFVSKPGLWRKCFRFSTLLLKQSTLEGYNLVSPLFDDTFVKVAHHILCGEKSDDDAGTGQIHTSLLLFFHAVVRNNLQSYTGCDTLETQHSFWTCLQRKWTDMGTSTEKLAIIGKMVPRQSNFGIGKVWNILVLVHDMVKVRASFVI